MYVCTYNHTLVPFIAVGHRVEFAEEEVNSESQQWYGHYGEMSCNIYACSKSYFV